MKGKLKNVSSFSFNYVVLSKIERALNLINPRKATTSNSIHPKLLNSTTNICSETLKTILNKCLIKAEFSSTLKLTDITQIIKREDPSRVKSQRSVSVLPMSQNLSIKGLLVFYPCPKNLWKNPTQAGNFLSWAVFSPFVCGYRKVFSTQKALLSLIERWKNTLDQNGHSDAILMVLFIPLIMIFL